MLAFYLTTGILGIIVLLLISLSRRKPSPLPLPPGPKKRPIIGNLLDLPTSYEWETYARWGKEYDSHILHLYAAGKDIVVINSATIANDLFNKKSSSYSSRPQFTMTSELLGWRWLISAMPYGEAWKERRKLFQKHFPASDGSIHKPRSMEFVRRLLPHLGDTQESIQELTRHTVGGIVLSIAYGIDIKPSDDPYISLAEQAIAGVIECSVPGAFLVDFIPALRYVPEWVPGAGFKTKAKRWRGLQERFHDEPFEVTKDRWANGIARPSFVEACLNSLEDGDNKKHREEVIKDTAGMFFAGGADTTVSALHSFLLAMLAYPEIQSKAQAELDQIVGTDRLPEFYDEERLPYLSAVLKETLRWRPVTPIAVPHLAAEDDIYEGYFIPKNTIMIGNVWAMLYDENDYPNPEVFNPERFLKDGKLNPEVRDPIEVAFGFGRRECPGKHIALSTLWITAASILSVFKITKAKNEDGSIIEPDMRYQSALVCHPQPFTCDIKPRSESAAQLIRSLSE
ncbi:cytochrome P450 [Crucibulum laeve]|uniref:Cytochrome P450 n=1 Tax=Crucibulum laeve TaxID=68775 RepID=A0A5C3LS95_9AGAR|nr:cytochrome P450 [Crucibulum laeve]